MTNNFNTTEIHNFDQLAQDWWDPHGPMRPLHLLNPLRLAYVEEQINLNGKQVLDVGCGGGLLSTALAEKGAKVSALDLSHALLAVAQQQAAKRQLNINYQCSTLEDFSAQHQNTFDLVTCMEMLEHVPNPLSILQHAALCLKPSGKLILSTLNRHPKAFLIAIVGAEYITQQLPKGTHHYAQFIKPSELCRMARASDLTLANLCGIKYHVSTSDFSLDESDLSVNYIATFNKS